MKVFEHDKKIAWKMGMLNNVLAENRSTLEYISIHRVTFESSLKEKIIHDVWAYGPTKNRFLFMAA